MSEEEIQLLSQEVKVEVSQVGGKNGGTYAKYFTGKITVWEKEYYTDSNSSLCGGKLELISGSAGRFSDIAGNYEFTVDNTKVASGNGRYSSQTYNTAQTIWEGEFPVTHEPNGEKTINFNAKLTFTTSSSFSPGNFDLSGSLKLTTIPREVTFNSFVVSNVDLNTAQFSYNVNKELIHSEFSLDEGKTWNTLNGNYSSITSGTWNQPNSDVVIGLKNLEPNKEYKISLRVAYVEGYWSYSETKTFTTLDIARILEAPNINIGESHTVTWSNPSNADLTLKLTKEDGTTVINYGTITGTALGITPTASTLYALIPNASSITLRYVISTTKNEKTYSSYKDVVFTVANSNPTFTTFTYADTNSTIIGLTGSNQILVSGYSNVKAMVAAANKAIAKNGATMKNYKLLVGDKSVIADYNDSATVIMEVKNVSSGIIDVYASDSRGLSTKVSKSVTIKDYKPIQIINFEAVRENNVGKTVTLKFDAEFWNESFGSVANSITSCKYRFKTTEDSEYIDGTTALTYTINGNKISGNIAVQGDLGAEGFSISESFNIDLIIEDKLSSDKESVIVGSGTPGMAIYKDKVAIGAGYDTSDDSRLQINGNTRLNGDMKGSNNLPLAEPSDNALFNDTNAGEFLEKSGLYNIKVDGTWYNLINIRHYNGNINKSADAAKYGAQIRRPFTSTSSMAQRTQSSGTWSGWKEIYSATILYNNATGSSGTITLANSSAYFKYLEIFYARSNDLRFTKSVTVPAPNGKTVSLDLVHPTSDANIYLQVYGETITISGTTITPVQGNMYGVSQTGFNYWQKEQTTGGNLYIYRVVGYN